MVALALLAYEIKGEEASVVIGTALAIKAGTYVVIAPLAAAFLGAVPKQRLLVLLDLARAGAILALPFAEALWQVYGAVAVFTAASAVWTPTYHALVPRLLADPATYAKAVAKSRMAGELENAASPMIAAALLLVLAPRGVFLAAMLAFLAAAAIVARLRLPALAPLIGASLWRRLWQGPLLVASTPALRFLVPLNLAVALGTAIVTVLTVVIVQGKEGLGPDASAIAFAAFGLGTLGGALAVPRLVGRAGLAATFGIGLALLVAALLAAAATAGVPALLALWFAIGLGTALALTPAPIALRRAVPEDEHAILYAAHFSLTHACLLVGYGAAGWLGAIVEPPTAFLLVGLAAACAGCAAVALLRAGGEADRPDEGG